MRPKLLVLDEPTEGIQPSIIKDIGRAIRFLRDRMGIAILLVEQYLDFARELADQVASWIVARSYGRRPDRR
jgi:urea transport system ATP-binding protein